MLLVEGIKRLGLCLEPRFNELLRFEARGDEGVTTNDLWDAFPEIAATQLSVALEFLKERGCVETRGRRNYPASNFLLEDAMVEYHALEA